MSHTIYATFTTENDAERAAGALLDHGVSKMDISFVVPERLEPIHTDYAGSIIPTGLHSTPANAPASYPATAQPGIAEVPGPVVTPHVPANAHDYVPVNVPDGMATVTTIPTRGPSIRTMASDTPIDTVNADRHRHIIDNNLELPNAARGISTTTAADAERGALEGGGIGIGLGLLLGLAAVAIPGVGLVAGTGALVAGLMAATGAAGVVAGGAYGYLADMGLPPETIHQMEYHLKNGGPILSIGIAGTIPETEIMMLLQKYNATSVQAF